MSIITCQNLKNSNKTLEKSGVCDILYLLFNFIRERKMNHEGQQLQEMITKSGFNINTFTINTLDDCNEAFLFIEDEISDIANDIANIFSEYSTQETLQLKEGHIEVVRKHQETSKSIMKAYDRIIVFLSKINDYLQQEKVPKKLFSLNSKYEEICIDVESIDKRILSYYKNHRFLPEITNELTLFYNAVEKYNQYIDIFDKRNEFVIKNILEYRNYRKPVLNKVENLKNFRPEK